MPAVSKQTARAKTNSSSGSVRDRIVPVSTITKGIKLLVYGRGKTGKTSLFSTFPKPALVIGTEDGTSSISDVEGIDFIFMQQTSDLLELVAVLQEGHYQSVGMDTAGGFQDLLLKEVLGLDEIPVSKYRQAGKGEAWGIADKATWGTVGTQFKERMRTFYKLADDHGIHIVTIAHERNFNDEGQSELLTPTVGAALTPGAAGWLNGACDYVCQTFIREERIETEQKVAGKKIKQYKKTGKAQYCLRIGPHPVFLTGFRISRGRELPDCIVDPTYEKLRSIIDGECHVE
jgi:hypothetical protein